MNPEDVSHEDAMRTAVRCQVALTVSTLNVTHKGRQAASYIVKIAGMYSDAKDEERAEVADSLHAILRSLYAKLLRAAITLYGKDSAVAVHLEAMGLHVRKLPIEDIVFVLTQFRDSEPRFSEN